MKRDKMLFDFSSNSILRLCWCSGFSWWCWYIYQCCRCSRKNVENEKLDLFQKISIAPKCKPVAIEILSTKFGGRPNEWQTECTDVLPQYYHFLPVKDRVLCSLTIMRVLYLNGCFYYYTTSYWLTLLTKLVWTIGWLRNYSERFTRLVFYWPFSLSNQI